MDNNHFGMALMFPMLAALVIVVFAGGLGVLFIVLNELVVEEWAVVALGTAIVVLVPAVAALAQRAVERE